MDTFKLYLAGKIVNVNEGKMKDLAMKIDRVASNMRKDRMMKPFADKFKKDAMKSMNIRKSLEKVLPDYVAGKTLDKVMKEDLDEVVQFAPAAMAVGNAAVRMAPAAGAAVQTVKKVFKKFTSKKEMKEMHCRDCNCEYGNIDPNCDCPNDGSNPEGKHWVRDTNEAMGARMHRMKAIDRINKSLAKKRNNPNEKDRDIQKINKSLQKQRQQRSESFKVKDIVIPNKGRHKGQKHEIIHDFGNGTYNIKPINLSPRQIKYTMGAAWAKKSDLKLVKETVEVNEAKRGGKILPPIPALTKAKIKHTHNQSSFKQNKTMVGVADKDYDKAKKIVGNMPNVMLHTENLNERNYRKEYDNYQGRPEQIANRSSRNSARRIMGDKAVKGMDVGHKDNNPLNNDPKNLQMEDPSENRREPRTRDVDEASKEGTIKIVKTKDNKFQVQRMTKGKFVNQGKPYKSQKDAEKVRGSGQHSMQFSHVEEKATDKRMRGWHKDYDFDQDRDIVKGFVSPKAKSMAKKIVKDAIPMSKAIQKIRSKFPGMKMDDISEQLKKEGLPQALKTKDSARRKEYNAFQKARRK